MKGLLQSKKFRKNLYKWLFMYVCAMLLLTSVVTYSKYITSIRDPHSTRVASFDININHKPNIVCEGKSCTTGTYRPTSKINYDFTVDMTEVEVLTDLEITVKVNDKFRILSVEEIKKSNELPTLTECQSEDKKSTDSKAILCGRIPASSTDGKKVIDYKVTVMYKNTGDIYEFVAPKDESGNILTYDIVTVGYSATQVTN